ncbi:type VI secretion system baseplate subunit TssE [Erythrobacter sp. EC-HK427]|uniref:type VI secretion system baseplate subunit TssE n=1 Tax=Erythrobacter sp. EC-HK427 TaxID=2038396 RepID=UPI00125B5AAA|nr:type VI secretion system baseplate subunit TssE [Erythrobacter sp. EC-HK427]VVT17993.1 Type VI secretion system protein ImpF [Erythrobacter sp. EC-HK427]
MITQSLLDRLIDLEPEQLVEAAQDDDDALSEYKIHLLRDLEHLLNTTQPIFVSHGPHEAMGDNIVGYGLADMATEDFSSDSVRDRLRRIVRDTIIRHEPRLHDVSVQADESPTSKGITFRIMAVLTISRDEEVVVYDANVRPSDKTIELDLGS